MKKMAEYYGLMAMVCGVLAAVFTYLWNTERSKNNKEAHQATQNEIKTESQVGRNQAKDIFEMSEKTRQRIMKSIEEVAKEPEPAVKIENSPGSVVQINKEGDNVVNKFEDKDPIFDIGRKGIHFDEKANDEYNYIRMDLTHSITPIHSPNINLYGVFDIMVDGKRVLTVSGTNWVEAPSIPAGAASRTLGKYLKKYSLINYYCYLKGDYTNISRTKTFEVDQVYHFDPNVPPPQTTQLAGPKRDEIIQLIENYIKEYGDPVKKSPDS